MGLLYVCQYIHASVHPSVPLYICGYICTSICLLIHPCICQCLYVFQASVCLLDIHTSVSMYLEPTSISDSQHQFPSELFKHLGDHLGIPGVLGFLLIV